MKKLTTLLFSILIIALSVDAEWIESDKGLYKILELDGAKIISINAILEDNSRVLSTITTRSGLYRCYEWRTPTLSKKACYVLRAD
jgi:hypothetical protein